MAVQFVHRVLMNVLEWLTWSDTSRLCAQPCFDLCIIVDLFNGRVLC